MQPPNKQRRLAGSTLAAVLITSGVLFAITASLLSVSLNRRQTVNQSSVWEEAFAAAEGGVHQGMAQLERALGQDSLPANPQPLSAVFESTLQRTVAYEIQRYVRPVQFCYSLEEEVDSL